MEDEGVVVKCANHHNLGHSKYFNLFNYLINWKEIFSYTPELIHLLIRISLNSYKITKNYSIEENKSARQLIIINLKRRYIINLLYNGICSICGEFNVKYHLPVFQFHHVDEKNKTVNAYDLFSNKLPCSEIIRILADEKGGFICGNCHSVLGLTKNNDVLNRVYDEPELVKRIIFDYEQACKRIKLITYNNRIKNPLQKARIINDNIFVYLLAIDEIIADGVDANNRNIATLLNLEDTTVRHMIHNRWDVFDQFLNFHQIARNRFKNYYFTSYGKKVVSLLKKFRDYYQQL
jgi:hypothetical protein